MRTEYDIGYRHSASNLHIIEEMDVLQRLTHSTAMYLDAILRLESDTHGVRVTDLSLDMGLKKGTVSGALKRIRAAGFIDYSPYHHIRLTTPGRELAEVIAARNRTVTEFLVGVLHLDVSLADLAARRMGPKVDTSVVEGMRRFMTWTSSSELSNIT